MVEMLTLCRRAGGAVALSLAVLLATAGTAAAGEFAQTPSFEGSYLALFGILGTVLLVLWLLIRITHRVELRDRHRGRPDLGPGGFLGDVDDDDDGVHIL